MDEQTLKAAREWLIECIGHFEDIQCLDDIETLSNDEIERGIIRNYGSLNNFKIEAQAWLQEQYKN
ncbi:peptide ABC transporter substrate-binding protein [Nostoc sp. TCL26-01]|uniref:peptide ABC transporter substrate-binding protein n=1 Tax=Nostoc sp. TCL26-01 TaxID=2576904 RepID=UPI0015BD9ED6|nr:peptide ABC transporter substrate-binding protein [Nostoc sp. TCL26-01]QLE59933.1 peptide ABC transporter substrate-binding protein [Nostoc sp. TCL26-01]